jgi:hypothetical protein
MYVWKNVGLVDKRQNKWKEAAKTDKSKEKITKY